MLRLVWAAHPGYALASVVLTLISAVVPPVQIWVSKLLIDGILEAIHAAGADQPADWRGLVNPVVLMLVVWLVGAACRSLSTNIRMLLAISSDNYTRQLILQKAASMDLAFFETPAFYDRLENASSQAHRAHNITYAVFSVVESFVSLVGMLLLLVTSLHPIAVPVLLLTAIPEAVALGYFVRRRHRVWSGRTRLRRLSRYLADLLTSRDAVKEIRLFGLAQPFVRRYTDACDLFLQDEREYRYSLVRTETGFQVISLLGSASLWALAVYRAVHGAITIGDVAVVFQATDHARQSVATTYDRFVRLYENRLYAAELMDFLELEADGVEGSLAPATAAPRPVPRPLREGIEFRNVSFAYPGSDQLVLRDFSCTLPAGAAIALVGRNGVGKTTLVKLLSRLYDPTAGAIYVDGVDLRELDRDAWRGQVGVVLQDFMRYDLTARENVGFGQIEYVDDAGRIARAVERSGARTVIEQLPDGLETMLGRTFDEGQDLSGGQWQSLALGRGDMRDAQLLILDEPTAALDALAELDVYQRFTDLTEGRTTILISHRFSTVRMADHILVLADGRLLEQGSHDELLAAGDHYAQMFTTQAQRYR